MTENSINNSNYFLILLKILKATINPKNNDNKCFQQALAVALNHKQIENHAERISNI